MRIAILCHGDMLITKIDQWIFSFFISLNVILCTSVFTFKVHGKNLVIIENLMNVLTSTCLCVKVVLMLHARKQ